MARYQIRRHAQSCYICRLPLATNEADARGAYSQTVEIINRRFIKWSLMKTGWTIFGALDLDSDVLIPKEESYNKMMSVWELESQNKVGLTGKDVSGGQYSAGMRHGGRDGSRHE